jgi:hypothetical protein
MFKVVRQLSMKLIHNSATDATGLPLPVWGEGGVRGLQLLFVIEKSKPLTPSLSQWERKPFVAPP